MKGDAVANLMAAGGFFNVVVIPDLDGRDRVVAGQIAGLDQDTQR